MLARLQGRTPGREREAEMWMGAHPRGTSTLISEGAEGRSGPASEIALGEFLRKHGELPFLFKIITAERGLSIQAHPDRGQAQSGYEREERLGIPLEAPNRNYRDRNHKPELVCAISEFQGMCGFRSFPDLVEEWSPILPLLPPGALQERLDEFCRAPTERSWSRAIGELLQLRTRGGDAKSSVLASIAEYTRTREHDHDRYWWVGELLRQFPDDPGAFAPLYLNLVQLKPGEAVFLDAGVLHAYLRGVAVEIMANSDNVLRAGCTDKHVDVDELLRVIRFGRTGVQVDPGRQDGGLLRYGSPAEEFALSRVLRDGEIRKTGGPAILLNTGPLIRCGGIALGPGESCFLDPEEHRWNVSGLTNASDLSSGVFLAALPGAVSLDDPV